MASVVVGRVVHHHHPQQNSSIAQQDLERSQSRFHEFCDDHHFLPSIPSSSTLQGGGGDSGASDVGYSRGVFNFPSNPFDCHLPSMPIHANPFSCHTPTPPTNPFLCHVAGSESDHHHSSGQTRLPKIDSGWFASSFSQQHHQHHHQQQPHHQQQHHQPHHANGIPVHVDPDQVFSPIQIQTLRAMLRNTVEEFFMFSKSSSFQVHSPISLSQSAQALMTHPTPMHPHESEDLGDEGPSSLTPAEKKLVRHAIEERWPDGCYPCPKDVKYNDLNNIVDAAATKVMSTKHVDNPAALKAKIKRQIHRALTNKRRHQAIKSNPEMHEKAINKMKRFRSKTKDDATTSGTIKSEECSVSPSTSLSSRDSSGTHSTPALPSPSNHHIHQSDSLSLLMNTSVEGL